MLGATIAAVCSIQSQCNYEFAIDTLNAATMKAFACRARAFADPAVRRRLTDIGLENFPREQRTPDALATYHKADIEKWWPIIKGAGSGQSKPGSSFERTCPASPRNTATSLWRTS
jgi:hypothetical protein